MNVTIVTPGGVEFEAMSAAPGDLPLPGDDVQIDERIFRVARRHFEMETDRFGLVLGRRAIVMLELRPLPPPPENHPDPEPFKPADEPEPEGWTESEASVRGDDLASLEHRDGRIAWVTRDMDVQAVDGKGNAIMVAPDVYAYLYRLANTPEPTKGSEGVGDGG